MMAHYGGASTVEAESKVPYNNLDVYEDDNLGEILYKKEQRLKRYEWILNILLTGAIFICIALITVLTSIMAPKPANEDPIQFRTDHFSNTLYNVLRKKGGNVFFSPYSLQVALTMAYTGAKGNTSKEIQKALQLPKSVDLVHKAVKASATTLLGEQNVSLNIANGMFVQKNYSILPAFTEKVKAVFDAEAQELNFVESGDAADKINEFVSKNTQGKINNLFSPGAFNSLTRLVLVNAIYFKGAWVHPFNTEETFKDYFYPAKDRKVQVDFMTITTKFNVSENEDLQSTVLELPYHGNFSMVLIVPKDQEGLNKVENKIRMKKTNLTTLIQETISREVHLTMPKFQLEMELDLEDDLKELGVKQMFSSGQADFSGITSKKDLYVSKVVHKAYIEVNEEGSEAAAASASQSRTKRSVDIPIPLHINVNHPFKFVIKKGKQIIFTGRLDWPGNETPTFMEVIEKKSFQWKPSIISDTCTSF